MKKLYLVLMTCLFAGGLIAQNFEEIVGGAPFKRVSGGSVAFADIDNDNDQDVLITGSDIAKLYANDGNNNFTEILETPFEGVSASSIAFADVDNDNDQDVLITGENYPLGYIAKLYTNDGNGIFTEAIDTPFEGVYMGSIAFADIDNDNDQDVLITGEHGQYPNYSRIAKLYSNDGNGNFTEVLDTPFEGVYNSSIAFADVDNDGDQDVLITGKQGQYPNYSRIAKLYINDGNGNFEEVIGTPFEGVHNSSIAFADVDNDNDQDVLITGDIGVWDGISKLYTNDGSGNFTEVTDTPFNGVSVSSIAFTDIDNDNDQDVLITGATSFNGNSPITKLYVNDGNGNFEEVSETPFFGVKYSSIAFADIDNDGDQDLLITGGTGSFIASSSTAILYTNDGNGYFEAVTTTFPFDWVTNGSVAFADVDNDGDQDMLITGYNTSGQKIAKLYTNDGFGNYEEVLGTPFDGVGSSSIAFADIDNDNDMDVLITGRNGFYPDNELIAKLYTNDGSGNFTEVLDTPFDGVWLGSIAFADIDNDNDQDVLITGRNGFNQDYEYIAKLYTNDGNGNFTELIGTPFDGVSESSIAFADIDNDYDQDVLITGYNISGQSIAKLYNNDGSGNFTEVTNTPFEGVSEGSIAFADIDNHNDQDVLITGWNGDESISKLYTNDSNGNFTEVLDTPFEGVRASSIAFADIDNDNDQDVLITGFNYPWYFGPIAKLYTNDGNGNYEELIGTPFVGVVSGSIAFADIDNDNDQDVLVTGSTYPDGGPGVSKLYRNLTIVGINETTLFNEASIFPNPNQGLINIDLASITDVSIKVLNLSGQLIYSKENIHTPIYQFELDAAPGIYILELSAKGEKQQFKLVKN